MYRYWNKIIIPLAALSISACSADKTDIKKDGFKAQISVTEYGIPHITADNFANLGFGEGYMAAKDQICNISYAVMTANGELSKYLGAGDNGQFLMQDVATIGLDIPARSKAGFEMQPMNVQDMHRGYAAGFNKYLAENDINSWCAGAAWVKPVTGLEIYNRTQFITQTLPQMSAALYMAQPPAAEAQQKLSKLDNQSLMAAVDAIHLKGKGSNAWAIGKDLSEKGRGMLLANPHYPWFGTNRMWEKQLTIPGEIDAYGVSLIGMPGVVIGFNKDIGWSHTVSNSQRIVMYKIDLLENDPTAYMLDGEEQKMQSKDVNVQVLDDDGNLNAVTKKLWFSHHGPVVNFPGLGWSDKYAYAMRDANRDNISVSAQWLDMSRASSMDALKDVHEKWNAMPWVNTIATGREGDAVFIDNSNVGHLSEQALKLWQDQYENDAMTHMFYDDRGLTLLNGNDSIFDFVEDGSAPVNGTVPYNQRPQLSRDDYVFNANDSYWLSSPHQPLSGYSPLYGSTETARTLRTSMNIIQLENERGDDGKFSLKELQQSILSNQNNAFNVYKDGLKRICETAETPLNDACGILSNYDGYLNIDSEGAILFREWLQAYNSLTDKNNRYLVKFSVDDPYMTPRGLGDDTLALQALDKAVKILVDNNIALDSALGDVQFAYRGSVILPMHGGHRFEGVTNMIDDRPGNTIGPMAKGELLNEWSHLTDKGYLVTGGTSFIMSLEYADDGPNAEAILTYGQAGNPENEHYNDQTNLFAQKKWRKIYFKTDEVEKNAITSFTLTSR